MSETTTARRERAPFDPNAEAAALRMFELMERGTLAEFEELTHPDMANHEAKGRAAGKPREARPGSRLRDRALAA